MDQIGGADLRAHRPPRKRARATAALLTVLLASPGCSEPPAAPTSLDQLPRELTLAESEVVDATNRFAFDLMREADRVDGQGNLFLSPLSASLALGMTMNGARGATREEMRSALAFGPLELQRINDSYRGLMSLLLGLDGDVSVTIANSIWYRRSFPFDESFFELAREFFDAEVTALDMADTDRGVINGWADRATGGRIPRIVDRIDPAHVMFLISAVHFDAPWAQRFDRKDTRDAPFHRADGTTTTVPMMNRRGRYGYASTPQAEVVELPYGNGAFVMSILLPHPGASVDELVAGLDSREWAAITAAIRPRELLLGMPRFRLEHEQELQEVLRTLGMEAAFAPGVADFTGMSATDGRSLMISRVLQRSFVEVDEDGTEAAAATSVEVVVVSAPQSVRVDRPFLFLIRERFTGTILFMGKVVAPG